MLAETPRPIHGLAGVIDTFDTASLQFDHEQGGYRAAPEDVYNLLLDSKYQPGRLGAFGQFEPIPAVCPACAYFESGRCHWCPGPEDAGYPSEYPECDGCKGKQREGRAWYRRSEVMVPLITTIAVTTVATVASTIILRRVGYKG